MKPNDYEPSPSPSEEDTEGEIVNEVPATYTTFHPDTELGTTPIYKKPQEESKIMNFYDALKEVMDGEMITKLEWADDHIYVSIVDKMLMIHLVSDGLFHPLNLSEEDIIGTDWVIVSKN